MNRASSTPVALVITHLAVGGATVTVRQLCAGLSDEFDIRVFCGPQEAGEGSMLESVARFAPVTVVPALGRSISPARDARAVGALRRALRGFDPALVHTHSSKAGVLGRAAAAGLGARVVHTVHGWGHTPNDPLPKRSVFVGLERMAARATDTLIAVSGDVREEGLRQRIGTPDQYEVIPPGVEYPEPVADIAGARAAARRALGLPEDTPVVGWVGRFAAQKDPECLAGALRHALTERRDLRAVLVGEGPDRDLVEARLAEDGVGDRVLFTGVRNDVPDLYPAFDVLVHPSRWEGQPRVVQESLAARVPVVATRASGVAELVTDGSTGYVLEPGDAAGVARQTLAVLDDDGLRAPLPSATIDALRSTNDESVAREMHRALYHRLLAAAGAR